MSRLCPDCKRRLEFVNRKFEDGEGQMGFTGCSYRRKGSMSCYDLYTYFLSAFRLGLKCVDESDVEGM